MRLNLTPRTRSLASALVGVFALLAFAAPASAQGVPEAQPHFLGTPAFANMVKGKTVRVTMSDGTRHEGRILGQTPTELKIGRDLWTTVPLDRIETVEEVSRGVQKGVLKGALIGFGSGFGLGTAVLLSCWGDECAASLLPALGFGALGAGIGAGLGALAGHSHHGSGVIYQAPRRTTVSLAPILSRTRKGMAFSMTWR